MIKITTTEPGFLGSYGSEPDAEIIEKHGGDFKNNLDHSPNVYIHGKLESWVGYDIPWFLAGTVEDKPKQEAILIHPDTKQEKECVLLIGKEYGYFLDKEEAEDFDRSILDVKELERMANDL